MEKRKLIYTFPLSALLLIVFEKANTNKELKKINKKVKVKDEGLCVFKNSLTTLII